VKKLLQQVTLKNKLLIIIMSTVVFSLILVALVFIVSERYISKQSMSDKLIVVSRILADQSTAALSFNDQKVAGEVLSALAQEPSVILGCLYDSDKILFARHAKLNSIECPKQSQPSQYQFNDNYFEIFQPVILDKEIIGSVYLRASLEILNVWLLKFIISVLSVIILAGVAAYFLAQKQQEIISEPILNLAEFVRKISHEGNYSHRLPTGNDDEIGTLYNAFNDLLEQIYHRQQARDKAEKTLSEREQFLSVTLNSIGDAVIVTDLDGTITRMNSVAEQLTGWTFKEAQTQLLKTVFNIVNIMDSETIESPVAKVVATGEIIFLDSNACLIAKDGTERLIADSAAPIRNNKNEILGVILVFNDVTESKRQEEQLRRSQKMDALGKLTGGIAHDYNNLLSIILGYAEQLKEPLSHDPLFIKYLSKNF